MDDPWRSRSNTFHSKDTDNNSFDDDFVNHLPDSEEYIASLEKKLAKISGKSVVSSSRDVVNSLSKIRQDVMATLINSSSACEFLNESLEQNGAIAAVERKLFPERQALTKEELEKLLEQDILARNTLALEISPTEDKSAEA
ncbi:hypothetical protein HDE_05528 [Halotydeus destructor]|nr:hypothetical protein HDE_05528 [Halotydeus destructor]